MSSRVTWFVTGSLGLSVMLAGACFMPGCSNASNEIETVTKPPEAAAAEKKSMEGMKKMMKKLATDKKKR